MNHVLLGKHAKVLEAVLKKTFDLECVLAPYGTDPDEKHPEEKNVTELVTLLHPADDPLDSPHAQVADDDSHLPILDLNV